MESLSTFSHIILSIFQRCPSTIIRTEIQQAADGNPDQWHNGISGGPQKALNFQILFNLFEKHFNLPISFVDLVNAAGSEFKIVGQEEILNAGFLIVKADFGK